MLIINEDGNIIKQFGNEYHSLYQIFHDAVSNQNKFVISKSSGTNTITEVYALPTSSLTTLEIQTQNKNKLSAFPVPANKLLNIMNPRMEETMFRSMMFPEKWYFIKALAQERKTLPLM